MGKKRTKRQEAIIRRRVFFSACAAGLFLLIAAVILIGKSLFANGEKAETESVAPPVAESQTEVISSEESASRESSAVDSSEQSTVSTQSQVPEEKPVTLDAKYTNLLLVNGKNPLPENYSYGGNLTTIPSQYINGFRNKVDKDIWPYMKAMLDAARKDGVKLAVLSPYRDYASQETLFQKQTERQKAADPTLTQEQAEAKAATVVARPGTSEHHTGLAADFNMVEDEFENTPMFRWLQKHAEEYGFILRYPKDKQEKTGVIYESWHWRFVGIDAAKDINRTGLCLEEYLEKNP